MKKYLTMILSLFALNYGSAQVNLVPNGDFETYSLCPNALGQITRAVPWDVPNIETSDYFNSCGSSIVNVPSNTDGFQVAHSGNGYVGVIAYHQMTSDIREYIQVKLSSKLIRGKSYCVTFYASAGDNLKWSVDRIGAVMTPNAISACYACLINIEPDIENTAGVVIDTTNWTKVSGIITAQGNEEYLTIGNFRPDSIITKSIVNNQPSNGWGAFIYIDDVSIFELPFAVAGKDSLICQKDSLQIGDSPNPGIVYQWQPTAGLSDATVSNPIANPQTTTTYTLTINDTSALHCNYTATDTVTITVNDCTPPVIFFVPTFLTGGQVLNISGLPPNSKFTLYNSLGQLLLEQENYSNQFNAADVAAGCYFYELEIPGENRQQGKICIVH